MKPKVNELVKFKKGDLVVFEPRSGAEKIDWGIIIDGPHLDNPLDCETYSVFYPSEKQIYKSFAAYLFLISHDYKVRLCS